MMSTEETISANSAIRLTCLILLYTPTLSKNTQKAPAEKQSIPRLAGAEEVDPAKTLAWSKTLSLRNIFRPRRGKEAQLTPWLTLERSQNSFSKEERTIKTLQSCQFMSFCSSFRGIMGKKRTLRAMRQILMMRKRKNISLIRPNGKENMMSLQNQNVKPWKWMKSLLFICLEPHRKWTETFTEPSYNTSYCSESASTRLVGKRSKRVMMQTTITRSKKIKMIQKGSSAWRTTLSMLQRFAMNLWLCSWKVRRILISLRMIRLT